MADTQRSKDMTKPRSQALHARIGLPVLNQALGHEYAKPDDVSRVPGNV